MLKPVITSILVFALATTSTLAGGLNFNGSGGKGPSIQFPDTNNDDDPPSFGDFYDPVTDLGSGSGGLIGKAPRIDLDSPTPANAPNKKFDIDYVPPADGVLTGAGDVAIAAISLTCAVAGTPAEFPNDILIANTGLVEIPARTRIVWQIESPRVSGTAVLAKALKPGKHTRANDVLRNGVEAGTPCNVLTPRN